MGQFGVSSYIHEGNIKLSGNGKTFKTRYVVVQNNLLMTFEKAPSYGACKPVKVRDLTNATVRAGSGLKDGLIAVEISLGKPVYLRTYDEEDAKAWTSSLRSAVKPPKPRTEATKDAKKTKAERSVNIYDPGRAPTKEERQKTRIKKTEEQLASKEAELEEQKARLKEERRQARRERKEAKKQAEDNRMKSAAAAAAAMSMSYAPPGGGGDAYAPPGGYAPPAVYAPAAAGGYGGGTYNPAAGVPPTFNPSMTYGTAAVTGAGPGGTFNPYAMPSVPTSDPSFGHAPTYNPTHNPGYYG